ncbi:MAG: branched-chain amino acid ABC transporter permease [Acidimicrobiales bacterium]
MRLFVNITLGGVAEGLIFASVALGLVLIFRATNIINFAQGAMATLTTFVAFSVFGKGVGYWPTFIVALACGLVLGGLVQLVLIRPVQSRPPLNAVIVTFGLLILLEGLAGAIWGNSNRGFPAAFSQSGLVIGHTAIAFSHFDVFIVVAVLALLILVGALFRFTTLGLRMRAAAFAPEAARLLGVRVSRLLTLGWAFAAVAGALAGLLVAPTSVFSPDFMDLILVYAFTAAVIGGLDSPLGALVGGLITGLALAYVGGYLGGALEPIGALVMLIVVLTIRPEGLFARPTARRV